MPSSTGIMQMTMLLLLASLVSLTTAQNILDSIPKCYQDCLVQSGDFTCNGLDVECMCRLSGGNFLTDVITCIRRDCDNNLNLSQLAGPITLACASVGAPIDSSVIDNAQSIDSSLAATAGEGAATPSTWTGVRTATSTFASAGTMYVVVVPLSASAGRFGIQTVTGSTRVVAAASITGDGQGLSVTADATARASSSSSSSSLKTGTSTSTTLVTAVISGPSITTATVLPGPTTTTTATAAASAGQEGEEEGGGGGRRSGQTGDGTPYVSSQAMSLLNSNQNNYYYNQHKWWGIGMCLILAVGGFAW